MVYNSVFVPSSPNTAIDYFIIELCIHGPIWSAYIVGGRGRGVDNVVYIGESTWGSCVLLLPRVSFSYTGM